MEIDRDLYTLWNVPIIGQAYETIVQLIKDNGVTDYDGYDSNATSRIIVCESPHLCFAFENDVVDSLTLYNPTLG
ncbi:hypothetical protein [Psychrobacter pygoscelis]|uniref:hypothetical protein n=1 Tax=Psychrobacter pygoscelis TaxID=2488563 RepID=UPI00103BD718|nr:hypothetical protein [Psychrobacter pygoscelis]